MEPGYYYLGHHRKLIEFDPRNTDNEIILDCFNTISNKTKNKLSLYQLMFIELKNQSAGILSEFPSSFSLIFHEISIAWNDIIHQMLFKDMLFDTFYGEYCELLNKIIKCNSPFDKEIVVYRYKNGETIFHLAAKLWLMTTAIRYRDEFKVRDIINKELTHIISCYTKLGRCFGKGMNDCIITAKDFSGKDLRQFLIDFSLELTSSEN
jgi:hypothetical protein